jgi:hypothetical protein
MMTLKRVSVLGTPKCVHRLGWEYEDRGAGERALRTNWTSQRRIGLVRFPRLRLGDNGFLI